MTPSTNRIVTGNSDASAHMHSNVLAHRNAAQNLKRESSAKETGGSTDDGIHAPSRYMLLISRVENMARRNVLDERSLEQLRTYLASHLGAASEAGRQSIANLREFAALEVEKVADLPVAVAQSVQEPSRAPAAFALLKQPTFSAFMRDDLRAQVYNPQGILRAS